MGRFLKFLAYIIAAFVALLTITAIVLTLVFDPNDFREDIAAGVARSTGRELVIEGDLELSIFPWLAIDIGKTRLGNAPDFGEEPFASFEHAQLSVRVLPLLLRREIAVGTAAIDTLTLNLQVRGDGRSNWQDLVDASEAGEAGPGDAKAADGDFAAFEIASIEIRNASINYTDAASGERIRLTGLNLTSDSIAPGKPVSLDGSFGFELQPAGLSGNVELQTSANINSGTGVITLHDVNISGVVEGLADAPAAWQFTAPLIEIQSGDEVADVGEIEVTVFGVVIAADVKPFSYADSLKPIATIKVDAFSARSLMHALNIEAPETADPDALGKVIMDATVSVTDSAINLTNLKLVVDDTNFSGEISVPRDPDGTYRVQLAADSIDLTRYMEPAAETAVNGGDAAAVSVDIPSDLIRLLNVRGTLSVTEAFLGHVRFENVQLGLNAANGRMRIHPITAGLFGGSYSGDIRINVSGDTPVIAVNENIRDVGLGALAIAMYEQENITGTIDGTFRLSGRGDNTAAIQQSLNGNMSFELRDGAWEGTDVWHELRSTRAKFKGEAPPEPVLPARTQFNTVRATGTVTDGVMRSDDLFAELPFMQLTGKGTVNFYEATVDYSMVGRILKRPEFMQDATAAEIDDFTQAVVPFRIRGPLSAPSIQLDFEAMLRDRVKKELKDRVLDQLLGGRDEKPAAQDDGAAEQPAEEPAEEKSLEDQLKDRLRDLLRG